MTPTPDFGLVPSDHDDSFEEKPVAVKEKPKKPKKMRKLKDNKLQNRFEAAFAN